MKNKKWFLLFLVIPVIIHLDIEIYFLSGILLAIFSKSERFISYEEKDNINLYSYTILENGENIEGKIIDVQIINYNQEDLLEGCNNNGFIFPKNIDGTKSKMFVFKEDHDRHFRSEIYLESEFLDSNSYFDEIQRLQFLEGKHSKKPIYSSDLFALPSYVATYNVDACYEYALFDEDNLKIIYIYLSSFDTYENIVFNIDYAPCRILKGSDFPRWAIKDGSYSIYNEEIINEKE